MKVWHRSLGLLTALVVTLSLVGGMRPVQAQTGFTDPAFQRTWERTDKPVADGRAQRSWYWGPQPNFSTVEPYKNAPGGQRKVQYFDKTRMEINNPAADPNNPFYVTNGLLANELMSGQMQVGDNDYETRCAANIPLASDGDDTVGPTYATFGTLKNAPKNNAVGQKAIATTDRAGTIGSDAAKASVAGTDLVYFEGITGRNIPKAFWEFLNAQGVVYVGGQFTNATINQPWFFASGLPVTEAYWAKAKIGGTQLDVLIQAYERRVLTYIPAYAGTPYAVQMGNVGQHYYDWRYKGVGCSGAPPATAQPPAATQPPAAITPSPAPVPPSSGADCTGIPDPKNATITPNCGKLSTRFNIHLRGFANDEKISLWFTAPSGRVVGTVRPLDIGSHGPELDDYVNGSELTGFTSDVNGIWAVTYQGASSGNQSIVWFKITPEGGSGAPPTQPPSAGSCDTNGTKNASVNPTSGRLGTQFTITVRGFQPGEQVGFWFTDPDGAVFGTEQTLTIGASSVSLPFNSSSLYPGRWAFTMHGLTSNNDAVAVFCITP